MTVEVVSHAPAPLAPLVEPLPRTGSEMLFLAAVGVALVLLGAVLAQLTQLRQEHINHG